METFVKYIFSVFLRFMLGFTLLHFISGDSIRTIIDDNIIWTIINVLLVYLVGTLLLLFLKLDELIWIIVDDNNLEVYSGWMTFAGMLILIVGFGMINHPAPGFPQFGWQRYILVFWMLAMGFLFVARNKKYGTLVMCAFDLLFMIMAKDSLAYGIWEKSIPQKFYLPLALYGVGAAASVVTIGYFEIRKKRIILEILLFAGMVCGAVGLTRIWLLRMGPEKTWTSQLWMVLLVYYIAKGIIVFTKKKE